MPPTRILPIGLIFLTGMMGVAISEETSTSELQTTESYSLAEIPIQTAAVPTTAQTAAVATTQTATTSTVTYKAYSFHVDPVITVPIQGRLRVEVITPQLLCLVGYYHDFLRERFLTECGDFMRWVDTQPVSSIPTWSRTYYYYHMGAEIIFKYRPVIAQAYQNVANFSLEMTPAAQSTTQSGSTAQATEVVSDLSVSTPALVIKIEQETGDISIQEGTTTLSVGSGNTTNTATESAPAITSGGYWLNPIGQACFPEVFTGLDKLTRSAEVVHFAFLNLDEPLEAGRTYTLHNPLNESVSFTYAPETQATGLIKYNQVGYSTQAGRKYAYAGAWLGTLGALDLSALSGHPFYVRESATGDIVFTGSLAKRGQEAYYNGDIPFTGEDVYQMDFSALSQEGAFYIEIPGTGRSPEFRIGNDAIGDAFYVHARGLYHKRCGIAKALPYTHWTCGECHMQTYRGHFAPNDLHYTASASRTEAGFFNAAGQQITIDHFKLIAANTTEEVIPGLHGGWHDAADYDRRPCHFDVVTDLLSVYLMRPQNFADNQLNLPESGNGIPDILDEVLWGMELWRKAQNPDGSVSTWIEATSHPQDPNPATDTQPYYLCDPTMESSMEYAGHAAMLAIALEDAGQHALSQTYLNSAKAAYAWASDPSHRAIFTYQYPFTRTVDGKSVTVIEPITYKELPEVPGQYIFKAALNLYVLTREQAYLDRCVSLNAQMSARFAETSWCTNPFFFTEFSLYHDLTPALAKTFTTYRDRMLKYADERLTWLNDGHPYRVPWYPPTHGYVSNMSWGKFHPFNHGKFFALADVLTGNPKYRDAAFICNDFQNGANPFGTTMTSGLGRRYPVKFLDLPSYTDGIAEYVPGISPYRNTFGINRDAAMLAHSLIYNSLWRPERGFTPAPVMLLPISIVGDPPYELDTFVKQLGKAWPIWRRYANVENFTVAASEFTVSETIAPAAALTGWLMEPGWQPSEALKNKQPAADIRELEGFAPLP